MNQVLSSWSRRANDRRDLVILTPQGLPRWSGRLPRDVGMRKRNDDQRLRGSSRTLKRSLPLVSEPEADTYPFPRKFMNSQQGHLLDSSGRFATCLARRRFALRICIASSQSKFLMCNLCDKSSSAYANLGRKRIEWGPPMCLGARGAGFARSSVPGLVTRKRGKRLMPETCSCYSRSPCVSTCMLRPPTGMAIQIRHGSLGRLPLRKRQNSLHTGR